MSFVCWLYRIGLVYLRGAVGSRPKPWTRLRCSESHWSNPVVLPVGQLGAPASSASLRAWFVVGGRELVTLQPAYSAGEKWYGFGCTTNVTLHTATHCRSFRDDDILECLEQFCGVEKAPCTDLRSDPTPHPKFLQNYAGRRVRQPRTPNTSAERKFTNLIKLKQYRVKRIVSPSDSHMLTSSSFFSLQTQHDQSRGNTNTTNKQNQQKQTKGKDVFPVSVCLMSSYVTQQLLFIK